MATMSEKSMRNPGTFGPTLSRRQFIKAGGILVVGFSFAGAEASEGRYGEARDVEELARSHAARVRGSRFIPTTRS